MNYELHHGDCLDVLPTLADNSVHCVIADIPYYRIVNGELNAVNVVLKQAEVVQWK